MDYLIFIVLVIFAILTATLVEAFKKMWCKNKTTKNSNILLAFLLSLVFGVASFFIIDICAIIPGVKIGLGVVAIYTAIIYLLQKPICLKVVKKIFKQLLLKKGFDINIEEKKE